jgi:hypothetical protein
MLCFCSYHRAVYVFAEKLDSDGSVSGASLSSLPPMTTPRSGFGCAFVEDGRALVAAGGMRLHFQGNLAMASVEVLRLDRSNAGWTRYLGSLCENHQCLTIGHIHRHNPVR